MQSPSRMPSYRKKIYDFGKVGVAIYLFFLLFAPPILPEINIVIPLFLLSMPLLLMFYRRECKHIFSNSILLRFSVLFFLFLTYLTVAASLSSAPGEAVSALYRFVMVFPVVFGCSIFVAAICLRRKYDATTVLKLVLYACLIQVSLSILSLLFEPIRTVFIDVMRANTDVLALSSEYHLERRFYGFANDLMDNFGYGMGIASVIPIIIAIQKRSMKWLLLAPLFLVCTLVNARTGLVVAASGVLVILIYSLRAKKTRTRIYGTVLTSIVAATVIFLSAPALASLNSEATDSLLGDTGSIVALISGSEVDPSTTAGNLLKQGIQLPENTAQLLFGAGINVFAGASSLPGYSSDVGYVNDIWLVGIVGSILLYGSLVYFVSKLGMHGKSYKILASVLIVAFFVFQIKGPAVKPGLGMVMTILLAVVLHTVLYKDSKMRLEA